MVDIGLLHLAQELASIGRKRFDIAALAFSVDGIESERRLAGSRQAGQDDQLVARDGEMDVFQVMLASALDGDDVFHGVPCSSAVQERRYLPGAIPTTLINAL